jgi:hypothetical protein
MAGVLINDPEKALRRLSIESLGSFEKCHQVLLYSRWE